jgi:hypothetical protein
MSLNDKSPQVSGTGQAEMAKVAVKNLVKLLKKCVSDRLEQPS